MITREGFVIDGYARLELARRQGHSVLVCMEYSLTDEEALRWLLHRHKPQKGWNSATRILIAKELEPALREKARSNQQAGGRDKLLSKLSEADAVSVRREVATAAGVSVGNVTKVSQLGKKIMPKCFDAMCGGEISIHRAWMWAKEAPASQLENLRILRIEHGIRRKTRMLVALHQKEIATEKAGSCSSSFQALAEMVNGVSAVKENCSKGLGRIDFSLLSVPGRGLYITEELFQALKRLRDKDENRKSL